MFNQVMELAKASKSYFQNHRERRLFFDISLITSCLLFTLCAIVTSQQYLGNPIECMQANKKDQAVPESVMNKFCFISATYISVDFKGPPETGRKHSFYPWVPLVLLLQGLSFLLPQNFWSYIDDGFFEKCLEDRNSLIIDKDKIQSLARYLSMRMNSFMMWSLGYVISELIFVLNVVINFYFTDIFLGGGFLEYGLQSFVNIKFSQATSFPPMTRCIFQKFGPSGTIERRDALCVMTLNMLNEKFYLLLWIWFSFLLIISVLIFISRLCFLTIVLMRKKIHEKRLLSTEAQAFAALCWLPVTLSSREVLTAWIRRRSASIKRIPSENVPSVLSDMHLCPTQAPVGAMLECAKEVGERGNHLNYGGIYKKDFFSQPKRSRGNSRHLSKTFDRNGQDKKRRSRKMYKRNVGRDVFLGGSCNPTTWRKDEAIPLLESLGISYFNPQVSEWTADLVAIEHNAKESASVLFYVLDRRTRNVVGIIEAANFAGTQRNLVLVTDPYKEGEPVAGENISQLEYEELCSGLSTLHDLVASQGIIVHSNIQDGIKWTAKILGNQTNSRNKESFKFLNGTAHEEVLRKNKEITNSSEKNDVHFPYYLSTNKTLTDLNGLTAKADPNDGITINIQQLRMMVRGQNTTSDLSRMFCTTLNGTSYRNDIYIGGSCFDYEWKESIALPILRQSRLKYTFAECGSLKSSRANQHEIKSMEDSKVLLFIITSRTRGLETMVLASYYIGCGRNMVLCIQNLPENSVIENETLSKVAVNDYNRGRVYLRDLASRSGVPVYESVSDAVQAAIAKCNNTFNAFR